MLFILVKWLIKVLPVGIFGFISALCVELASGVSIGGLGTYFATVLTANFLQMLVVLPLVLLIRGLNPLRVARGMMPALLVAFFSKSSAGTLPVTMACSEERVGVRPAVARFVLPICTTINMNACAAFILITSVFLMQNAGAEITLGTLGVWVLIATIAAVGNAGGAHRLVPDIDGVGGLDVRQPVMVNDLQDLGLLQARDRLGPLVVVHQHHPFAPWPEQMVLVQQSRNLLPLVQNGVAGSPLLQNNFLDVVHQIIQVEGY